MNRFLAQPDFSTLPGMVLEDSPFVLNVPLIYRTDVLADRNQIYMPEGFRSDLATVPQFVRCIYSVAGWWRDASWPHDFCCNPVDFDLIPIPHFCSSDEAADVWYEALMNTVGQMDLTPKQYIRKERSARFLTWAVRRGGPQFEAGDIWIGDSIESGTELVI